MVFPQEISDARTLGIRSATIWQFPRLVVLRELRERAEERKERKERNDKQETVGFGSSSATEREDYLAYPGSIPPKKVSFEHKTPGPMSIRSSASAQAQLALFLSAQELTFVANDISTYKQFITIFNPYNFNVRFKAFCTSPTKYELSQGGGTVPALNSIDLVVRLKDSSDPGTVDKFRFKITEQSNLNNVLGERELSVLFLAENPTPSEKSPKESFRPHRASATRRIVEVEENHDSEPKPNIFVIILGIACLISLCLPTNGESSESMLAQYLSLSINQKLIAAFVLGMVTMVIFRTK